MRKTSPYRAVADATRRKILDVLRDDGPQRAGDIAARFPLSRPAVSRHLRVLRRSGFVEEAREGRERWYRLNPTPLHQMYQEWFRHYEFFWSERLAVLKRVVEEDERRRRSK
ncbi:MAG TPA: metalloregulator ArsR/SmtB family transcription factor [bacterium]|jgi:DNA-binding transcriptional ArsR family regulator|nr:metalloregulator ArsR/SmtB family transcription factor [bacterium]